MQFKKIKSEREPGWRTELNQYEQRFLLPALKERMQALKEYFDSLVAICNGLRGDPTFGSMLIKLTTAPSGARLITPNLTDVQMSEKYFSEVIKMANENYLDSINELLKKYDFKMDLENFADTMNKTNHIVSSVLQAKDKLFLYDFSAFYSLHDKTSGELVDVVPRELTVLLMPFKNLLQNMVFLCEGVSGTIQTWHKEQIEWRSRTLELTNNRLSKQIQFLTIGVTLGLSVLFFMMVDPYKQYQLEKINDMLSEQSGQLKNSLKLAEEKNNLFMAEKKCEKIKSKK